VIEGKVVSVWDYVPTVSEPPPSARELALILRDLHARPMPPHPPDPLTDPLASIAAAINETADAVPGPQSEWLSARITQLRVRWKELSFPHPPCLIHGDAHPRNLMRTPDGKLILGDWDHAAVGPREWDLAQIFYTSQRFGQPIPQELDEFGAAYGWNPRDWPGLPDLVAIREISGLSPYIRSATAKPFSQRELRHRLPILQAGDTQARWNRPPPEATA
jgi:aminoglycoside phosphotransferase (APT) family kinase protein